jgi:hypothetical protein
MKGKEKRKKKKEKEKPFLKTQPTPTRLITILLVDGNVREYSTFELEYLVKIHPERWKC